jgi:hypothetical protein
MLQEPEARLPSGSTSAGANAGGRHGN